jgi:hypothetical protein
MVHAPTGGLFFGLRKATDGSEHEIWSEISIINLEEHTGAEDERNECEGSHS